MDTEMEFVLPRASVSSKTSSSQSLTSTRAQRRGSRTTNACEACKKRKTKCSGPPSVCEACQKVDTFCHFNLRLDTRRKLAYKPRIVRERQQYILEGILQILKHNDIHAVQEFIKLIRSEARPQEIAHCLKDNLHHLQSRSLIPAVDVDETDLVSLGLQSLFSHRAGRNVVKPKDEVTSPTSSERNDLQKSFTNTSHSSFTGTPTTAGPYQTSFGDMDANGMFKTDIHALGHLDTDSMSDESAEITYGHDYTKILSPTDPNNTSSFGSFARAILTSNTRPVLPTTDHFPPVYWRTTSPTPLEYVNFQRHGPQEIPVSISNSRMQNEDTTCIDFRQLSQRLPVPSVPMGTLVASSKLGYDFASRDRISHDYWNIPSWA